MTLDLLCGMAALLAFMGAPIGLAVRGASSPRVKRYGRFEREDGETYDHN